MVRFDYSRLSFWFLLNTTGTNGLFYFTIRMDYWFMLKATGIMIIGLGMANISTTTVTPTRVNGWTTWDTDLVSTRTATQASNGWGPGIMAFVLLLSQIQGQLPWFLCLWVLHLSNLKEAVSRGWHTGVLESCDSKFDSKPKMSCIPLKISHVVACARCT